MLLAQRSFSDEPLYECDVCHIVGDRRTYVMLEESGRHFCFSCWFENERNRPKKEKTAVAEEFFICP